MEPFVRKFGFERSEVTLDNWKDHPYSTWSLQHVSELIPIATIEGPGSRAKVRNVDREILDLPIGLSSESERILDFLNRSYTDAFWITHRGTVVGEYFANGMTAESPHLIFSVSKSVAGLLAGAVVRDFGMDTHSKVTEYLPEANNSAYADCTVRDLLDMQVSVDFEESYESKDGLYARYRRSMLWMPAGAEEQFSREDLASYVLSLPKGKGEHGGTFSYRSPNTDVLGLVLERVSGVRYPDLVSRFLWRPIGADTATITVDNLGASRVAGGISCTVQDLALLGELLIAGGTANGVQVIPRNWVNDTINGGDTTAWKSGDFARLFPEGSYRNQWYSLGDGSICAIGIHGQWLYVNPKEEVVIVRLSSQPAPDDDEFDSRIVKVFAVISTYLGA